MNEIKYYILRFIILLIYALLIASIITVVFGTLFIVKDYAKFINETLRRSIGWILGLFLSGLLILGIKSLPPYLDMLNDFAKKVKADNKN